MKIVVSIISILILSTLLPVVEAQTVEEERVSQLRQYIESRPQEKLFVQLDKPYYAVNEDIWFKTYLVDAVNHLPRKESLVYIELINDQEEIIAKRNIQIINGGGFGDISLKSLKIKAGAYTLRGYTSYMRNFDEDYFFYQQVNILNSESPKQTDVAETKKSVNVEFFPEGGELVVGTLNFLAFKVTGDYKSSHLFKGTIITSEGEEIARFKTEKFGMGLIPLKLNNFQSLKAKVEFNGEVLEFPLPKVLPAGFTLSVRNTGNNLVLLADHTQEGKMEKAFVLVHQRGKLLSIIKAEDNISIQKAFKIDKLPAGIITFTLFDGQGMPSRERIVFVENKKQSKEPLTIKTSKSKFKLREKVALNFDNPSNKTVVGTGSVSITNLGIIPAHSRKSHLLSNLLLSSDIKGYIENPAYYFDKNNKDRLKHLDLLMMTQGWRRFTWKQMINQEAPSFKYPIETGITVQGQLFDFYDKKTPIQGEVKMLITDMPGQFKTVKSDENGYFFFPDLGIGDTSTVILQSNRINKKGKTAAKNVGVQIALTDPENHPVTTREFTEVDNGKESEKEELEEFVKVSKLISAVDSAFSLEGVIILDEFKVDAERSTTLDLKNPFRLSDILYGRPTRRVIMDSIYMQRPIIRPFDALRSIPGVFSSGRGVRIQGASPKYVLDGVFTSPNVINSLPVSMISHIDVFKGTDGIIFGPDGVNGVIAFFTKDSWGSGEREKGGVANFEIVGYSIGREFYTPDYSEKSDKHKKPDYRSTLYWNPEIDFSNKTPINFYTSDDKGTYLIHLEGITSSGRIILEEKIIEVR